MNFRAGLLAGNGTIYTTNNASTSWTTLQSATNQDLNSIHTFDGINLWAVGNSGVVSTNYTAETGIEIIDLNIPGTFFVEQNYPNPFNPSTKIRFGVVEESNVVIEIYNIAGQKLDEIVNDYMSGGYYEVNFNASKLSSGIYFYTIRTKDNHVTRKMTLLR